MLARLVPIPDSRQQAAADCSQPAAICDVSALKAVGQLSASALVAVVLTENDTGKPQGGFISGEVHLAPPYNLIRVNGRQPLDKRLCVCVCYVYYEHMFVCVCVLCVHMNVCVCVSVCVCVLGG